jgi:hypothetical protein
MCETADHWIRTSDARIPRRRIARGKRIREDIVDPALDGKTVPRTAALVDTSADSSDDRRDRGTSVTMSD